MRAITDPDDVELLPDPAIAGAPAHHWWPPRLLDPAEVALHVSGFDVLHVHFGLETHPVAGIAAALDAVHEAGRWVVFTVHDLENPQLVDQTEHRRALDAVIARADALLTLTDVAADEIAQRWGRAAHVVPHPRLQLPAPGPRPAGAAVRVGMHLRDLRPNVDGVGAVGTLLRAVAELRAGGAAVIAEVHLDERVRDDEVARRIERLVAGRGDVELRRHGRLGDGELAAAVARIDALVLPYAWGTHSGWVELAYDAALPVVGPGTGAFAAQHPDDYEVYAIGDPASLAHAIAAATTRPWAHPGPARDLEQTRREAIRDAELTAVRATHTSLYRDLVAAEVAA